MSPCVLSSHSLKHLPDSFCHQPTQQESRSTNQIGLTRNHSQRLGVSQHLVLANFPRHILHMIYFQNQGMRIDWFYELFQLLRDVSGVYRSGEEFGGCSR